MKLVFVLAYFFIGVGFGSYVLNKSHTRSEENAMLMLVLWPLVLLLIAMHKASKVWGWLE